MGRSEQRPYRPFLMVRQAHHERGQAVLKMASRDVFGKIVVVP